MRANRNRASVTTRDTRLSKQVSSIRPPQEQDLIRRILKGERKLFHDLVRPYERAVFMTAFAVLRNQADAEDAAQETMIKAFTRLEQLQSADKFKPWLLQIAVNEARLKRRGRRDFQYEPLDSPQDAEEMYMPRDFADWREIPSETLERKEIRQIVNRALLELPALYREIFLLRDVQQLNVEECVETLGVSEQVIKVRLHRARLMMREKLAPAFKRGFLAKWLSFKGSNPWSHVKTF